MHRSDLTGPLLASIARPGLHLSAEDQPRYLHHGHVLAHRLLQLRARYRLLGAILTAAARQYHARGRAQRVPGRFPRQPRLPDSDGLCRVLPALYQHLLAEPSRLFEHPPALEGPHPHQDAAAAQRQEAKHAGQTRL